MWGFGGCHGTSACTLGEKVSHWRVFEVKQDRLGERIPVLALASTGHDSLGKSGNQFVLLALGVRCHGWIGVFQKSILTPVGLYDNQIKQILHQFLCLHRMCHGSLANVSFSHCLLPVCPRCKSRSPGASENESQWHWERWLNSLPCSWEPSKTLSKAVTFSGCNQQQSSFPWRASPWPAPTTLAGLVA